jgi:hypothetical protein
MTKNLGHVQRRMLELNGETKSVHEWMKQSGLPEKVFMSRLHDGWELEHILAVPYKKRVLYEAFGETRSIAEWAATHGITRATLDKRIAQGIPMEEALLMGSRRYT